MGKQLDAATRARRLVALLPHLHRGDRVPLAELAAAVGCSAEEVAADLTTLTMCGIPPFTPFDMVDLDIDGDAVTVYMDPPGLDQPLRLTMPEARALAAALEVADYAADSPLRMKLNEVSALDVSSEELARTVRTGAAPGGVAEIYESLAGAAADHEKLQITYYTGSTGRLSERTVHPWALAQRLGTWYLVGMCEAAGAERVFRLDRIRSVSHTGVLFEPPSLVDTGVTPVPEQLPAAVIRFSEDSRLPDERAWPGVRLERQADGSTLATMPYQSTSWIARRVVAYLGSATVLEPAEVRDAVRQLARETLDSIL